MVTRKDQGVTDVFAILQRDLSPNLKEGNVLKFIRGSEQELQRAQVKIMKKYTKTLKALEALN